MKRKWDVRKQKARTNGTKEIKLIKKRGGREGKMAKGEVNK